MLRSSPTAAASHTRLVARISPATGGTPYRAVHRGTERTTLSQDRTQAISTTTSSGKELSAPEGPSINESRKETPKRVSDSNTDTAPLILPPHSLSYPSTKSNGAALCILSRTLRQARKDTIELNYNLSVARLYGQHTLSTLTEQTRARLAGNATFILRELDEQLRRMRAGAQKVMDPGLEFAMNGLREDPVEDKTVSRMWDSNLKFTATSRSARETGDNNDRGNSPSPREKKSQVGSLALFIKKMVWGTEPSRAWEQEASEVSSVVQETSLPQSENGQLFKETELPLGTVFDTEAVKGPAIAQDTVPIQSRDNQLGREATVPSERLWDTEPIKIWETMASEDTNVVYDTTPLRSYKAQVGEEIQQAPEKIFDTVLVRSEESRAPTDSGIVFDTIPLQSRIGQGSGDSKLRQGRLWDTQVVRVWETEASKATSIVFDTIPLQSRTDQGNDDTELKQERLWDTQSVRVWETKALRDTSIVFDTIPLQSRSNQGNDDTELKQKRLWDTQSVRVWETKALQNTGIVLDTLPLQSEEIQAKEKTEVSSRIWGKLRHVRVWDTTAVKTWPTRPVFQSQPETVTQAPLHAAENESSEELPDNRLFSRSSSGVEDISNAPYKLEPPTPGSSADYDALMYAASDCIDLSKKARKRLAHAWRDASQAGCERLQSDLDDLEKMLSDKSQRHPRCMPARRILKKLPHLNVNGVKKISKRVNRLWEEELDLAATSDDAHKLFMAKHNTFMRIWSYVALIEWALNKKDWQDIHPTLIPLITEVLGKKIVATIKEFDDRIAKASQHTISEESSATAPSSDNEPGTGTKPVESLDAVSTSNTGNNSSTPQAPPSAAAALKSQPSTAEAPIAPPTSESLPESILEGDTFEGKDGSGTSEWDAFLDPDTRARMETPKVTYRDFVLRKFMEDNPGFVLNLRDLLVEKYPFYKGISLDMLENLVMAASTRDPGYTIGNFFEILVELEGWPKIKECGMKIEATGWVSDQPYTFFTGTDLRDTVGPLTDGAIGYIDSSKPSDNGQLAGTIHLLGIFEAKSGIYSALFKADNRVKAQLVKGNQNHLKALATEIFNKRVEPELQRAGKLVPASQADFVKKFVSLNIVGGQLVTDAIRLKVAKVIWYQGKPYAVDIDFSRLQFIIFRPKDQDLSSNLEKDMKKFDERGFVPISLIESSATREDIEAAYLDTLNSIQEWTDSGLMMEDEEQLAESSENEWSDPLSTVDPEAEPDSSWLSEAVNNRQTKEQPATAKYVPRQVSIKKEQARPLVTEPVPLIEPESEQVEDSPGRKHPRRASKQPKSSQPMLRRTRSAPEEPKTANEKTEADESPSSAHPTTEDPHARTQSTPPPAPTSSTSTDNDSSSPSMSFSRPPTRYPHARIQQAPPLPRSPVPIEPPRSTQSSRVAFYETYTYYFGTLSNSWSGSDASCVRIRTGAPSISMTNSTRASAAQNGSPFFYSEEVSLDTLPVDLMHLLGDLLEKKEKEEGGGWVVCGVRLVQKKSFTVMLVQTQYRTPLVFC
ncbi:hypothetical protein BJ508DRAFT_329634 [Ascobolus immersus RN42]|uniref:Uncharacterized protein n=1 Tax=Ascobolus immersus RN42 TaxID=1160509 RepID=A0A3N4HXU1_ASCIM|nr:hypothetical protein BJ508DRAFT_329634 [Ascobolus immersus RN42]